MSNIFEDIGNKVKASLDSRAERRRQDKAVDIEERAKQEKYKADALEFKSLMADSRYTAFQGFIDNTQKELEDLQQRILTSDWTGYTREARADKAAIIASQIGILRLLREHPENVLKKIVESL